MLAATTTQLSNEYGPFATMGFWTEKDLAYALQLNNFFTSTASIVNRHQVPYRMIHQWDRPQLHKTAGIKWLFALHSLTVGSGYAPKPPVAQASHPEAIRQDGRCGRKFKAPDGSRRPGECHPVGRSAYGGGPECCNVANGFCGDTPQHCTCPSCIKYYVNKTR
jgi:hypothetical protein